MVDSKQRTAPDRLARTLAAIGFAISLVALILAGYATHLGLRYLDDVQALGESLQERSSEVPLNSPPLQLDTD